MSESVEWCLDLFVFSARKDVIRLHQRFEHQLLRRLQLLDLSDPASGWPADPPIRTPCQQPVCNELKVRATTNAHCDIAVGTQTPQIRCAKGGWVGRDAATAASGEAMGAVGRG